MDSLRKSMLRNLAEGESENIDDIYFDYKLLRSLRLVTRGITHNYNNIFSGALGCLNRSAGGDDPEHTRTLAELINRAIGETEVLFGFARHSRKKKWEQSFTGIMENAVRALKAISPRHRVEYFCENHFLKVNCDHSELVLLLFYLGENAIEAMADGGKVSFNVAELSDDNGRLWLEVVIRDDGPGVDPQVRDTMFAPFVTTKEREGHYGLGLYIAKQIARSHGGDLVFLPKSVRIGDYILRLPVAAPKDSSRDATSGDKPGTSAVRNKNRQVFFVIDDDAILLDYLVTGLQRKGHIVFSASSCKEAIEDFGNVCNIVTLFVVDIGLTDNNGIECVSKLKEINDSPGVIFMSGDEVDCTSITKDGASFLRKPFTIRQLEELAENVTTS